MERRPGPGHAGRTTSLGRLVPPRVGRLSGPVLARLRLELGAEHGLDGVKQGLRERDDEEVGTTAQRRRASEAKTCARALLPWDWICQFTRQVRGRWGGVPTRSAERRHSRSIPRRAVAVLFWARSQPRIPLLEKLMSHKPSTTVNFTLNNAVAALRCTSSSCRPSSPRSQAHLQIHLSPPRRAGYS